MSRLAASGGGAREVFGAGLVLAAVLALVPQPAAASTPTVRLTPDNGGPGVKVSLRATGFCGAESCGQVTVTMGGYQVAGGVQPDRSGAFRTTFVVPGGLVPGQIYVIAKQTHDDGNEAQAMAGFVYSPSKGEAAERKAAEAETLEQLVNPTRPAANRGVPLASVPGPAEKVRPGPARTASTVHATHRTPRAASTRDWWPYAAVGGAGAVLALVVLSRRRAQLAAARHLRR